MEIEGLRHDLEALGLAIVPFTAALAETMARLRSATRQAGLSRRPGLPGPGRGFGLPAITTDRIWPDLGLPVKIRVVR